MKESKEGRIMYETSHEMTRRDKAELLSKGIHKVTEIADNELTFEKELSNSNLAYQFMIHFSAFKPLSEVKFYGLIPNKLYFKFSILNHEEITTQVVVISKPPEKVISSNMPMLLFKDFKPMSEAGKNLNNKLIFYKIEIKELYVRFEYDPSVNVHTDLRDFYNHFAKKYVLIEVFDPEKVLPFGFAKLPLKSLLRQGKHSFKSLPLELDIYNVCIFSLYYILGKPRFSRLFTSYHI